MRRVVLGGEEIEDFGEGPNIKLLITPRGGEPEGSLKAPDGRPICPEEAKWPALRTYSVRRFDASAGELTVDFVLHGKEEPAADWAARAQPGDLLGVGGPGSRKLGVARRHLFAGDERAAGDRLNAGGSASGGERAGLHRDRGQGGRAGLALPCRH